MDERMFYNGAVQSEDVGVGLMVRSKLQTKVQTCKWSPEVRLINAKWWGHCGVERAVCGRQRPKSCVRG